MKSIITLLAITFSLNTFANEGFSRGTSGLSLLPSVLTGMSSGGRGWKKNDIEKKVTEYHQSGTLSPELAEMVKEVREIYEVSESEAVDMILDMLGE